MSSKSILDSTREWSGNVTMSENKDQQDVPIIAQAFDNQWLPTGFVKDYLYGDALERSRAIEKVSQADASNIQEVAASQLGIINSYYQSGLHQSQQSFRWSLIWGGIGFGFLIAAVGVLLFRQPTEVALASGIAGALVEVFAGTYLYLYKHASDQLAAFRTSLESTQRLLLANSMCEKLKGEMEQTTRVELIRQMVNSAVYSQGVIPMDKGKKV